MFVAISQNDSLANGSAFPVKSCQVSTRSTPLVKCQIKRGNRKKATNAATDKTKSIGDQSRRRQMAKKLGLVDTALDRADGDFGDKPACTNDVNDNILDAVLFIIKGTTERTRIEQPSTVAPPKTKLRRRRRRSSKSDEMKDITTGQAMNPLWESHPLVPMDTDGSTRRHSSGYMDKLIESNQKYQRRRYKLMNSSYQPSSSISA